MSTPFPDYTGRLVDVLAFQGVPGQPQTFPALLTQSLAAEGEGGRVCAGVQKLAQWFLKTLLTPAGTKLADPSVGCDFMADAATGRWRTIGDVRSSFASSMVDIRRQARTRVTASTPTDEQLQTVTLDGVTFDGDRKVTLEMTLRSLAEDVTFLAPITVPLR